eukprot:TRINITY_DN10931_c0_g1_i1.p1 TRINITY_DN10931_c0_g1~~TRINITY_DN10931_c0_g1_i1.p1  ORF type:complete len:650 (+),score=68.60 TRINITY_DN10931_c0_g1_i1:1654-3603(+)
MMLTNNSRSSCSRWTLVIYNIQATMFLLHIALAFFALGTSAGSTQPDNQISPAAPSISITDGKLVLQAEENSTIEIQVRVPRQQMRPLNRFHFTCQIDDNALDLKELYGVRQLLLESQAAIASLTEANANLTAHLTKMTNCQIEGKIWNEEQQECKSLRLEIDACLQSTAGSVRLSQSGSRLEACIIRDAVGEWIDIGARPDVLASNLTAMGAVIDQPAEITSKYIIIANYRIRHDGTSGHMATQYRVQIRPSKETPQSLHAMTLVEDVLPSSSRNFINVGGSVSWRADGYEMFDSLVLQTRSGTQSSGTSTMFNDANGEPEWIATDVGANITKSINNVDGHDDGAGCAMSNNVCYIPVKATADLTLEDSVAFQRLTITDEAPGRYVVMVNYRLQLPNSIYMVRAFLTCSNCSPLSTEDADKSDPRMLGENIGARSGQDSTIIGGQVSWIVEKAAGLATIDVRYTGRSAEHRMKFLSTEDEPANALAWPCFGHCGTSHITQGVGNVNTLNREQEANFGPAGSYLVCSNFRIHHQPGSDDHGFVKMTITANGISKTLMVTEGIRPAPGASFMIWAGSICVPFFSSSRNENFFSEFVSVSSPPSDWSWYSNEWGRSPLIVIQVPHGWLRAPVPHRTGVAEEWQDLSSLIDS